ncbi:MAG TPA: M23 family metallopeptidase [Luteibacter sp.]|uniref:M23 family metallopeptidase n=1 Tax=Luteibacter sp. TaxID=1886636 RepID=UPI002BDD4F06|nr:M23 family metallopeptidase [Luteibacter sp.]HVI53838.1 M23 family metallopeptidase [Luteibacter sp.]
MPFAPSPFNGSDGHQHLAYEVQVTNVYGDTGTLRPRSLDVLDENDRVLLHLDEAGMAAAIRPAPEDGKPAGIAAGKRGTLFVWITLPAGAPPQTLRHRIVFTDEKGRTSRVDGVSVTVSDRTPLHLGAPLKGGLWLAHEGPGNAHSHHWGSLVAVNGTLTIPQRFAIDFVGIDKRGRAFKSVKDIHATTYADWFGYGADVLAVASGTVVAVRDGQDEHKPLEGQPEPASLSLDGLFGNYVVIDLGGGNFAGYAHLKRGSVSVTLGQTVARGQVIGALGQSGNSAAPHLHFQMANAATFEGAEGVPYVFDKVDSFGPESEGQLFGIGDRWQPAKIRHGFDQLPLSDTVVSFPR